MDLNHQPSPYEGAAPPLSYKNSVGRTGLEPAFTTFTLLLNISQGGYLPIFELPEGLEPSLFLSTKQVLRHLSIESMV